MARKKTYVARAKGVVKTTSREDHMAKTAVVSRVGKSGRFVVKKDSGDTEVVMAHPKTSATVKSIVTKRRDALKRLANR